MPLADSTCGCCCRVLLTRHPSKLRLSLPHKVDAERGTAKWDGKRKALSVTLPIIRPDPFA